MAQTAPQGEPQNCREFTAQVMVGGQPQQAVGQACQQPDGTWRVTQNTPGSPQQVYTLPPQAIYVYPYPEAYDWNPWSTGRRSSSAERSSSPMAFTVSTTTGSIMASSTGSTIGLTTVAFPMGVSTAVLPTTVLPTAVFTLDLSVVGPLPSRRPECHQPLALQVPVHQSRRRLVHLKLRRNCCDCPGPSALVEIDDHADTARV